MAAVQNLYTMTIVVLTFRFVFGYRANHIVSCDSDKLLHICNELGVSNECWFSTDEDVFTNA